MHKFQYVAVPATSSSGSRTHSNNNNPGNLYTNHHHHPKAHLILEHSFRLLLINFYFCSLPKVLALFRAKPVGQIDWVCLGFISMSLILFTVPMYPKERGTRGDKLITGHFRLLHSPIDSLIVVNYYLILTWNNIREFNQLWPLLRNRRWRANKYVFGIFATTQQHLFVCNLIVSSSS